MLGLSVLGKVMDYLQHFDLVAFYGAFGCRRTVSEVLRTLGCRKEQQVLTQLIVNSTGRLLPLGYLLKVTHWTRTSDARVTTLPQQLGNTKLCKACHFPSNPNAWRDRDLE